MMDSLTDFSNPGRIAILLLPPLNLSSNYVSRFPQFLKNSSFSHESVIENVIEITLKTPIFQWLRGNKSGIFNKRNQNPLCYRYTIGQAERMIIHPHFHSPPMTSCHHIDDSC